MWQINLVWNIEHFVCNPISINFLPRIIPLGLYLPLNTFMWNKLTIFIFVFFFVPVSKKVKLSFIKSYFIKHFIKCFFYQPLLARCYRFIPKNKCWYLIRTFGIYYSDCIYSASRPFLSHH